MKPTDFVELLGDLDDRYLIEARSTPSRRPRRIVAILAATLCLIGLIGGTTVYAATEKGQWILDIFTRRSFGGSSDYSESGYRLDFEIERISADELSSEVLALGDEIVQAIRDYQPHMSHIPNIQYRRFDTAAEACAFVGYAPLSMPNLGLAENGTTITVWGDIEGQIGHVSIEQNLSTETLVVQSFATVYTTHHIGSVGTGVATLDWEVFTPTEQITPSGRRCLIVRSSPMDNDQTERRSVEAYLLRDNIFYRLHLAHAPTTLETMRAEGILEAWIAALD